MRGGTVYGTGSALDIKRQPFLIKPEPAKLEGEALPCLVKHSAEDRHRLPLPERGSRLLTAIRTSYHAPVLKLVSVSYYIYGFDSPFCFNQTGKNCEKTHKNAKKE
jgi:hypothetical protein